MDQELHDNTHFGLLQVCGSLLVHLCDYLNVYASCDFVRLISVIHDYTGFARYLNDQSHGLFCFAVDIPSLFLYYFYLIYNGRGQEVVYGNLRHYLLL